MERCCKIFKLRVVFKVRTVAEIAHQLNASTRTVERDWAWIRQQRLSDFHTRIVADEYLLESLTELDTVEQEAWRIFSKHPPTAVVKGEVMQLDDSPRKLAALRTVLLTIQTRNHLLGLSTPAQVEKFTALMRETGSTNMITIERLTFPERLRAGGEDLLHDRPELEAEGYVPITHDQT